MYVPSYSGCTTQILTWGPIADRSFRGLGRSVRSDRPSRSGPIYSVSVYNPSAVGNHKSHPSKKKLCGSPGKNR